MTATAALMVLSVVGTYGIISMRGRSGIPINAADSPPGQAASNDSVYIYATFYAGGAGAELSIKEGGVNTGMQEACGVSMPYRAEWTGNQGIKAGVAQPEMLTLLLSKELPKGTRLGNFGPYINCDTGYVYRAELLNTPASETAPKGEVYLRSSFWAGNVAPNGMTVQPGEIPETEVTLCGITMVYQAPVIGGEIGKTAQGDVDPIYFTKELPPGTRLGNFGPSITCNGAYFYRAEILN